MTERELHEFAQRAGRNFETPQAARELDDVEMRLKHMDELGIDVQVLHNTFWIERITTRPEAEIALCRSWNRWLADISKKSAGRLFYSCVVPAMSIDAAIEEVKFAKDNGAAAVCMRPLEGDRHLSDPYFYPLYKIASDLDLSIAVHIANGNPENADLYRLAPAGRFAQFRVPTVTACYDVIMSDLHELFPKLRWGFIEASAQWVPWIYREAAIRYRAGGSLSTSVSSGWPVQRGQQLRGTVTRSGRPSPGGPRPDAPPPSARAGTAPPCASRRCRRSACAACPISVHARRVRDRADPIC